MRGPISKKNKTTKFKSVSLQVLTNGHAKEVNFRLPDRNSRTFENRMVPRYDSIPQLPEELPQPEFSESSQRILKERYLLKGGSLETVETVAERFWRVSYDLASSGFDFGESKKEVLEKAKKFYIMMVKQEFEPNSPTIMNAGKQNGLQYSACFVLPIGDSLSEIFDSIKFTALIHQTGGGTGFSFSRLRGKGSRVKTTGGVASGPVSFLRVFNAATESIKQGGTRRGANMGILRIDHPDILEFIRCKAELDDNNQPVFDSVAPMLPSDEARDYFKTLLLDRQISNFNISAAVTDKFMEAFHKGENYDLVDPKTGEALSQLNAREVFEEIVDRAWKTGDPGVVFIDRINKSTANPISELEVIEATNPCGEQPLAAWDACNLGSINLGKFVKADGSDVDWQGLAEVTHLSVEFLDDVVQTNPLTLEPIYDQVHKNRRIGLGVMGFADMLFKLKVPYGSDAALKLAEDVMGFITTEGHKQSQDLAESRGAFPNWPYSIYHGRGHLGSAYKNDKPLRNSTVTTIAPTGSISIIADCSSGIEPLFALAYLHKAKGVGDKVRTLVIANKTFEEIAKREGFYTEELAQKVMERGTVSGLDEVPADWQQVFTTAQEIDPIWHVKMQAAFQKHTDNGVSKTINLPNSATRDDISKAYLLAWETGCLGITVYRDGSKGTQVLNVSSSLKSKSEANSVAKSEVELDSQDTIDTRPMVLRGRTYKIATPVGEAFVTVNRDNKDQPFEVFVTIGKAGMHTSADAEALGRMISMVLRLSKGSRKEIAQKIVQQLRGIGGASQVGFGKDRVMSLADAIAKAFAEELAILEATQESNESQPELLPLALTMSKAETVEQPLLAAGQPTLFSKSKMADLCPECGQATFIREDGCHKCYSCGYSKC